MTPEELAHMMRQQLLVDQKIMQLRQLIWFRILALNNLKLCNVAQTFQYFGTRQCRS